MSNKRKREDEDGGALSPAWKKQAARDGQRGMSINKILSRHQRYDNRQVKQKQFYEKAKKLRAFHTLIKREERERQAHGESAIRNVYEEEEERKKMEKALHLDMEEEEKQEEKEEKEEDEEIQSEEPSNTNTTKNKTNTNIKQSSQPFHHPDRQPKPPKPAKMTPEMRAAERARAENEYQERQQRLAASKRERSAKRKLANTKTKKGQPIMANRMEALLTRLQATIPSTSSTTSKPTTSAKQR